MIAYIERQISMIIAKKTYDKGMIGWVSKKLDAVPVVRQGVHFN